MKGYDEKHHAYHVNRDVTSNEHTPLSVSSHRAIVSSIARQHHIEKRYHESCKLQSSYRSFVNKQNWIYKDEITEYSIIFVSYDGP